MNRLILQFNAKLNLYPWRFESRGKLATAGVTRLRSLGFRLELIFASLYAVYIDLMLIREVTAGLDKARYDLFGMHLLRSLVATTFSYWAYEFFVAHSTEHEMLYNFTQQSPGNLSESFVADRTTLWS